MSESFKTSFASLQHSDFFKGVGNIHLSTRLTEKSAHAAAACCLLVVGSQLGQCFSEVAYSKVSIIKPGRSRLLEFE